MRILKYALLIISIYIVQAVLLGQFGFLKTKPDVLLVLIIAAVFFSEDSEGIYVGLSIGVFRDLAATDTFGFYTILSLLAVLMAGLFNKRMFKDNVFLFAFIVLTISVPYEIMSCVLIMIHNFISGSAAVSIMGYLYYLQTYSAVAILMNCIVAFVMFFVVKIIFYRKSYKLKGYA